MVHDWLYIISPRKMYGEWVMSRLRRKRRMLTNVERAMIVSALAFTGIHAAMRATGENRACAKEALTGLVQDTLKLQRKLVRAHEIELRQR